MTRARCHPSETNATNEINGVRLHFKNQQNDRRLVGRLDRHGRAVPGGRDAVGRRRVNRSSSIVNPLSSSPCSGASMTAALHLSRHSATTPDLLPPGATRWDEPQRTQRAQRIQIHVSLFAISAFSAVKKSPLPFKNPKSKIHYPTADSEFSPPPLPNPPPALDGTSLAGSPHSLRHRSIPSP